MTCTCPNGVFLYRLADIAPGPGTAIFELEDCYLLDVVRVTVDELRARGLRVVTPGRAAAPDAEQPS